ncbi:alpha-rhamnosidase [Mucilaginibacter limnophilus]|uniref:Alpha-rhamnosidase n=1 Tax=Mucilaginibacter limnophilus TaxID=1932778 RepID=A0A437MZ32_9SPHI|nr:alpha-L-rhamnosidase C-terminal domain-containing protein [Mucilaginibacter limnophilus]RVU02922.1 alpha-rhamnosidase [Mucilaginibacter limnophilus]
MISIKSSRFALLTVLVLLLLSSTYANAQTIRQKLLQNQWKASWITVPGASGKGYGVYYFRKQINIHSKPSAFIVHVSADNRYKLYVNGKLVSIGPTSSDLAHWNFMTVDIAPFLISGRNTFAAQVWNEGDWRPEAQISLRTGFILQGQNEAEMLNTGTGWKCIADSSYSPLTVKTPAYYAAGPGQIVNMNRSVKKWQTSDVDDSRWQNAKIISPGIPINTIGEDVATDAWLLQPSILPPMELTYQRLTAVRQSNKGLNIPDGFPSQKKSVTIPANSKVNILLDQGFLTNAYPTIGFSRGKGATLALTYAEALYTKYPAKGNRNDVEGKTMIGRMDSLISDGTTGQQFTPLSWRTFRYLQISVTTSDEALVIDDIYGTFVGYPFKQNASVQTSNTDINKILEIGWRTARLSAVETYMDCPYYEQLQYIGDTRIQAMVSLYNSGDDRLIRNALNNMDNSRRPEGITLSRYPSKTPQYIPTFSLWYLGMLYDYWMYGSDPAFVKNKLPGTRQILNYFNQYQQSDGSISNMPFWMFTDWAKGEGWHLGRGPKSSDGTSALIDLQLLWAYQLAAELESRIGMKEYVVEYNKRIVQLKATIRRKYWNANRQLFADRLEKDLYSQHTNALAILTGVISNEERAVVAKNILTDKSLAAASIYFKYYVHQALTKAGLGNDYLNWLDKWRQNIQMGLTTWGETSEIDTTRSDCHAWGASPNIEFFRTLLGIDTDAPGFSKVKITPHLGGIKNISGTIPHPNGKISVEYINRANNYYIKIVLPQNITGTLLWKGRLYNLHGASNQFVLN